MEHDPPSLMPNAPKRLEPNSLMREQFTEEQQRRLRGKQVSIACMPFRAFEGFERLTFEAIAAFSED
jgi:hypothetical protein